jgi:hypothetical protein
MPITLVVEDGTGLAGANALASRAAVQAVLDGHPFTTAWDDKTDDEKDVLIAEGSAWIARLPWLGVRRNATQAMPVPCVGLYAPDGYPIPSTSVPAFVVRALARLCLFLAQQTTSVFADTGLAPGTELEVGPIRLTPSSVPFALPPDVRAELAPYIGSRSTLVRG